MNDDTKSVEDVQKTTKPNELSDLYLGHDWTALEEAEWWNYVFLY